MRRRIGLLHSVSFLADTFRELIQEQLPGVDSFHIVDEGIIQELMREGKLTYAVVRRVVKQTFLACDTGADVILYTCSSTSPAVDKVRPLVETPILKIDDPLAQTAVQSGKRIGVLASVQSALDPSVKLIHSWAEKLSKSVEVSGKLQDEAFQARVAGDIARHDEMIKASIVALARENDVVVLAQASMAHLAVEMREEVDVPVLESVSLCMQALREMTTEKA